MGKYVYACTRPEGVLCSQHPDCQRCKVAGCGYSFCFEFNERWERQGGVSGWEHCIENMPCPGEKATCPMFGHECPGGAAAVSECEAAQAW